MTGTTDDRSGPVDVERPKKRQRRPRPCYNCEECRRLKMKCDRQAPCSNCVRRNCPQLCSLDSPARPAGGATHGPTSSRGDNVVTNADPPSHSDGRQYLQAHQPDPQAQGHVYLPQRQEIHQAARDQTQANGSSHGPESQPNPDLLAFALESYVDRGHYSSTQPDQPSSHRLPSSPSKMHGTNNLPRPNTAVVEERPSDGSYGTLMIGEGGRSKYLGPTAGSEWLKDSEQHEVAGSTSLSLTRAPSPATPGGSVSMQQDHATGSTMLSGFPFSVPTTSISTRQLFSNLPFKEDAWSLVECYYRYCAWHHDVAPKARFEKTFANVYAVADGHSTSRGNPQEIALVFAILATGTVYNIEMAFDASTAEHWLHLAELALVKGDFLSNNTVAGLQTLHLMAHLHLNWDKGSRGDKAWPLWGLVMRLMQAMGMHRDGARWNLPEEVVEERRKVFWECHAADIFQAHCFSRPSAINPEHCDTAFPLDTSISTGEKGYFTLRFELSQMSSEILNMAMKVRKPAYSDVLELDAKLSAFERSIPFVLRSRTACLTMPSRYLLVEDAIQASPEPSRTSVAITFQRMNLAFNTCETIINLHRPYFAKYLYGEVEDDVKSVYAHSFLTIVERCAIIFALVTDVQSRFPNVATRQWNLWYHVFGSAICLSTLLLRDPGNSMSPFVLDQIDAAISLFTSLVSHGGGTSRYRANLQWLIKIRERASTKMRSATSTQKQQPQRDTEPHDHGRGGSEDGEDEELLGWRTRLIERAGQEHRVIRTIRRSTVDPSESPETSNARRIRPYTNQTFNQDIPTGFTNQATPDSTNDILRDFWDPMLLQDVLEPYHGQEDALAINGQAWWEDPIIRHL